MYPPSEDPDHRVIDRFRRFFGQRFAGIILTLLFEALVLLLFLSIGRSIILPDTAPTTITTIDMTPLGDDAPAPPQPESDAPPTQPTQPQDAPTPPTPQLAPPPPAANRPPVPAAPAIIPVSPNTMRDSDIANLPSRPSNRARQGPIGPAAPSTAGDTPRASGSGPNGEPLYAAAWYREPTDQQMRGYLSTADGPGWALIACRTVPDYRVEDCVQLDEYPRNSHIGRSVLAAAWQFRVIPPRIGGQYQVGEWVRIRIDYGVDQR